jgi:hypothetical protein
MLARSLLTIAYGGCLLALLAVPGAGTRSAKGTFSTKRQVVIELTD